ncbi:MAG: hypothetical protein QXW72_06845 [Conexivisphaerales archaeon]
MDGNVNSLIGIRLSFVFMFSINQKIITADINDVDPSSFNMERLNELNDAELHVLGENFLKADRLKRHPVSKFELPITSQDEAKPYIAEVYLLTHKEGSEIIEVWIEAPEQEFNPYRLLDLLKPESQNGFVKCIHRSLSYLKDEPPLFTFIGIFGSGIDVDEFIDDHRVDIVNLLYLNSSPVPFKASFVDNEINRNFCIREGGASFMSGFSALNIMFVNTKETNGD